MSDIFAVRDVGEDTKRFIHTYARRHKIKVGKAMEQLVYLAQEHLKEGAKKRKYKSFLESVEKCGFKGPADMSARIDEFAYGD